MSLFPYLLTSVATTIILGTVACAQNADTTATQQDLGKINKSNIGLSKTEKKFDRINFTGAYLAARTARINFDFQNAQKNAQNSFVLADMKNPYLAEQAIRLSLIQQDLDTAIELAKQHVKTFETVPTLKDPPKKQEKPAMGIFSALVLLVDQVKQDNPKQALKLFEELQSSFNKPMRALIGGSIYRLNHDPKKAELIETNLSGFDLFDMMRLYHAANNAYINKQDDKAIVLFEKSGTYTDVLSVRSLLAAVQIHLKKGEKQKAVDLLKFHRRSKPDGLVWAASESLERGEDFKFSLPQNYLQVIGEDLYNIGILYARQGDYESAIAFFRIAEITGVSHAYLLSGLAEAYAIIKDYDTAAELYLNIAKSDQFLIGRESLVGATLTLNAAKRHDDAEKLLSDAIAKDNKYYRYPYVFGDLLRGRFEYKRAIPYFTQAIDLLGDKNLKIKWRILYGRAICYEQTDDWEKAEKDFLDALQIAPNNPDLINYLAYSWVDRGVHLDKALLMLQHAVNNRPESGYIADSLGWALFRMDKYLEALPVMENAIALMPQEPVINDHLGDVYWKIGRKNEAIFQWNHALDFEPSTKDKALIKAKIAVGYDKAKAYLEEQKITKNQDNQAHKDNHTQIALPQESSFLNMIKSFFSRFSGK